MILMQSKELEITKINNETQAEFFRDLQIGDIVIFSVPLRSAGASRGRTYSTDVTISNVKTLDSCSWSFNHMINRIRGFEFKEYKLNKSK